MKPRKQSSSRAWRGWQVCLTLAATALIPAAVSLGAELPTGSAPRPVRAPHMPSRMHTFVWRNWESVDLERMARVLATTPEKVRQVGASMGLPAHVRPTELQVRRSYLSVIRRNWHLLPYEQLLDLLGWDADLLAHTLKEDDFLWIKVGSLKPKCAPLTYAPPNEAQQKRCAEIKTIVQQQFGDLSQIPSEPRFDFVRQLSTVTAKPKSLESRSRDDEPIRFLYSYFAMFGDPLLDPRLDPFPDGLLQRLAQMGVNGVWLHTLLNQLAPSEDFPEFGKDHEKRLAGLRGLVQRAKAYGVNIYLYMNEPRCMSAGFFEKYGDLAGARSGNNVAMCTSVPVVRKYLTEGLRYVFTQVPDLGGIFTITASENLTNCCSKGGQAQCPRCSKRKAGDIIAEVNTAMRDGVRQGSPKAKVIVWDWGWADDWVESAIAGLPDDVYLMSVSEWSLPIERGGIKSRVGEYSISSVGPGPRARRHWALAQKRGLRTLAKVQVNCTWELSAVPFLPAMNLVGTHASNLSRTGVDGLMLSWTLGGYPSPNLDLVSRFAGDSPPTVEQALADVATSRYGAGAAEVVLKAWMQFSDAFLEYPYHPGYVYRGPTQYGPSNLLYPEPTGYSSTMIGFPYDDVAGWRAVYPPEILAGQFEKVAAGWKDGLVTLRSAADRADGDHRKTILEDAGIAEAAYLHFKSVVNQVRFTQARDALLAQSLPEADRRTHLAIIRAAATDEIDLAKRLFGLTSRDSRIGFEASNHYYYYPLDLVEKVVNCDDMLKRYAPK